MVERAIAVAGHCCVDIIPTFETASTLTPGKLLHVGPAHFSTGGPVPNTAALTYAPGQTVSNLVIAKVGTGGTVSLRNASGSVHLIVEVLGWYSA